VPKSFHPIRTLAVFLLLGAAITGCTRPAAEIGPDAISTQVAATLTAVAYTPAVGGLPTWTPPPSATVPPSPTETTTLTATIGPTVTATPPTLPTDDPRYGLNLSAPDLTDDFSDVQWFQFSDPDSATNIWEQGHWRATDHLADSFIWWSTSAHTGSDVYAEVTAVIGTCTGRDGYGLALRVGGAFDRGYSLEFSCDGSYRLRKWISGEAPVVLLDWTSSSDIRTGSDQENRMGLLASASGLFAFANGHPLAGVTDPDYVAGTYALYASAAETADLTVTFDDFATWSVSP
jgi:hypothetical protein